MRLPILTNALCLPLVALLSSCSGEPNPTLPKERGTTFQERFTAADKAAARVLSIGDRGAIEGQGPYKQAVLCNIAVSAVAARLANLQALDSQQLRQLEQAQAIFERRLRQAAAQEGKSPAEIERDLKGPAAEDTQTADQGRIAIACLQSLQPSA